MLGSGTGTGSCV